MMRMMNMARLLPLLLLFALAGCREQVAPEEPLRPVKSVVATADRPMAQSLPAGRVQAHTEVSVAFRMTGKVAARHAAVGDRVRAGQKLARLDDTVARDALTAAGAEVAAARAALEQSQKQAERTARLLRRHAVSQSEREIAQRQFRAAKAQLEAALAREHAAAEQLDYAVLQAPAGGVITERLVESGEVVAAGQPVFRLAADTGRDAVFDAPESLLGALRIGGRIEVCLTDRRNLCSSATLYEIAPKADRITGTYQIRALLDNAAEMPLGAALTGALPAGGAPAISIPAAALGNVDGRPVVWIVDPASATVSTRVVRIGNYLKDTVIIEAGLAAGETVVTAGVQNLRQGQKVRLMNSDARP